MNAPHFHAPVWVADIGGTHTRLALAEAGGHGPAVTLATGDHADLPALLAAGQRAGLPPPRTVLAGAAGPVTGPVMHLTNARHGDRPIVLDGAAAALAGWVEEGLFLNDFEAVALALPAFGPRDWVPVGENRPRAPGPALVIGPGTGLGVAALLAVGDMATPLAAEAGYTDFGPRDATEGAILEALPAELWPADGRIFAEFLISGPGLARLEAALRRRDGAPPASGTPADSVRRAHHGDPHAVAAAALMLRLLARFAGNMALTFRAGEVWLTGGMIDRLAPWLDGAAFCNTMADKGPYRALLAALPIRRITRPLPALIGLARLAAAPERHGLPWSERLWSQASRTTAATRP